MLKPVPEFNFFLRLNNIPLLEKEIATHSSTIAWKIPWTQKPGRWRSMRLQRVGHDWAKAIKRQYSIIGLYNIVCIHSSVSGFLDYFHLWLLWTFAHTSAKRSSVCIQFFWVHPQKWSCCARCWFYVYFFEELLYSLPSQLYCFTFTLDCWVFYLIQGLNKKFLWTMTFCLHQSLHLMVCWSNSWCLFRFLSFLGHFSEVFFLLFCFVFVFFFCFFCFCQIKGLWNTGCVF